ncbi:unnamed protein product [Adineta steineri]|uniref:protein kinase C n=2 Tax=Adineta steineri TaxID=433720 RepID=A0A813PN88_9BILA|nr:unnamed protein product [Adineta steineri]CAF3533560.1 unnamed protein product [Adineta steineri]
MASTKPSISDGLRMTQNIHAFLRISILNFQINNNQHIHLSDVKTQIELKEKHRSLDDNIERPARVKFPMYSEKEQCIQFDAGILNKIKRQIVIRVHANNVIYTYESDLDVLKKLSDGHRHRFFFIPRAQAEMIIKYKDPSGRTVYNINSNQADSRYAERRQHVHRHFGHEFVPKIFKLPTYCSVCSKLLWGFTYQGFTCQRCDCVAHNECYNQYSCPCKGKKYPELKMDEPHHFEQQPFSLKPVFCHHCGSFIRPGHVQKCSYCAFTVHRRCASKVGNYCGCEEDVLAIYEKWRDTRNYQADNDYLYNEDLYTIYSNLDNTDQVGDAQSAIDRISKRYRPNITSGFDISHFRLIRSLGQGMNGSVYLVQYGRNYYAMKVLRKNLVLEGQDLAYVMLEKDILIQSQSNPFIIQLMYAFQNAERLFFIMEVAKGGNFYRLLIKQAPRPFRYERIVFHTGEVACALQFLHSKRIVYRDLKPENVLVFEDGHVKLGDFGLCKKDIDQYPKAVTFCGTQEYIAYEIYRHCEYDENVDWWSLGVFIFELFTFVTPFYDEDDFQIEENVLHKEVYYPETMPIEAKKIISGLLERDPKNRLGNKLSPHGLLSQQSFFESPYTLDDIENRRVPPPWTPSSLTSFDPSGDELRLSEFEQKDKVLLASIPEKTFAGFSYVSAKSVTRF